jgi:three-Cys-motif partner protein
MDSTQDKTIPNNYLECEDDGEYISPVKGKWGMKKLYYLNVYSSITTVTMSTKPWRQLNYIDLFSGCGKNKVKRTGKIFLGSPLLSLKLQKPYTKYFFVDNDERNISALRTRCNSSLLASRIEYHIGDGNQKVKGIVEKIAKIDKPYIEGCWQSFNVAFLDPYSFELEWNTIGLLATIKYMDLIIYYPQGPLERAMPTMYNQKKENAIDFFFGTDEWRTIFIKFISGKVPNLHRELLDLYWKKLSSLRYIQNNGKEPLITNSKNVPLYRLILASRDPKGIQFWNEAIKRDENGQMKLC